MSSGFHDPRHDLQLSYLPPHGHGRTVLIVTHLLQFCIPEPTLSLVLPHHYLFVVTVDLE